MNPVPAVRSLRKPIPKPPAFARTYRGRDGWDRVLEYQRVMDYCADHPEKGSMAVSSAVELPRSRIRSWVDGDGAPDPVHGLRTALDRDWLIPEHHVRRRRALAVCVTWIFAGGSIANENFTPRFAAHSDAEQERIIDTAAKLGVQLTWVNREGDGQGVEAIPANDASVFGRILLAAGAPNDPDTVLPDWILEEPAKTRRAVAAAYVECRGQLVGQGEILRIAEETRPESHLGLLGDLFVDVAGVGSYSTGERNLHLDREGTDALLDAIDVGLKK